MPARRPVADSADLLLSDAEAVDRATARLRALARRLQDDPATPPWFAAVAGAHIKAATIAAADLSRAAADLRALSEAARRSTAPLLRVPRQGRAGLRSSRSPDATTRYDT
ncbi:hypothetical protein [Actinomadura chokoriensis]|uniref:Uncharacterized protein n=1 Tax=Actinomadura chokoriensis TaxID=454156 RepID=A0ABV4R2P0_9ACTN